MAIHDGHELHHRRLGRNAGVALALAAFAAVVFGLTVAKIEGGSLLEANDHVARPQLLENGAAD